MALFLPSKPPMVRGRGLGKRGEKPRLQEEKQEKRRRKSSKSLMRRSKEKKIEGTFEKNARREGQLGRRKM
jgi:hypothetical protein